ncbi:MAG TPA: carboxypeptidase regulatory-like domain-containing protein, partial [Ktedonobacteraceae bacterium]
MNQVPQPPALTDQPDLVEQAVTRLNEAAHLIEQEEDQGKIDRKARPYSRVSRLAPLVDISADIRRESTPLPKISGVGESEPASRDDLKLQVGYGNSPAYVNPGSALPDYWPWLDTDTEEKDNDIWANSTDPLISRHFPNSAEAAGIEEEDMRRAMADGIPTAQFPVSFARRHFSRMRIAFIALAIIALIALVVDSILLNVAFNHPHYADGVQGGLPTLTLSTNAAKVNDTVTLKLEHFSPSASVALTHDVQEPVLINGHATIATDAQGTASVPFVIDTNWGPGFHLIVAEDVATRNTASATLQITGQGPTPPPHLLIDTTPIAMGADVVGANSIHTFNLSNSGGGSITWSASSHQPWLLISPSQGIFSQDQTISLAVQRVGLKPGDYTGSITISTNVSVAQQLEVDMTVRPLPPNAGPVVALSPALLSFTTSDGDAHDSAQALTISNPGSHTLSWSLAISDSATTTTQWALAHAQGLTCGWLSATPTSGIVAPGASSVLRVNVHSQCLLPGTYLGTLKVMGNGAIDGSQTVNVSLTVQPHCGLVTSTGYLAFTVVQGQSTLANQTLSLNATASCAGTPLPWTSTSTASWLAITPASGQLQGTASAAVSVSVNAATLPPKPYYGNLSFVTGQSTLTIMVQLNVQAPSSSAPIMGASPLSLNFSNTQGQPNPTGQVVTVTNNGASALKWNAYAMPLASNWLGASPTGGTIVPGQTGQVTININTAKLTPGSYVGQVTLNGADAKGNLAPGSPQTITVTLVVQPPCAISPPSASSLSFSAVQGAAANPTAQTVMFTGTGNCVWPVTWKISPTPNWLSLTSAAGTIKGTGQSGSIGVGANIANLPAGTYTTKVTISASDASGATVQGSPQPFSVTLTVLPPCVLSSPSPGSLSFTVPQGQTSATVQNVALSETGTCARPVTWHASGDAGSSAWLVLSATSGTDGGSGSPLGVKVNAANLLPGMYNGTITITATDSSGATVVGSPQTVGVTLTVTGFTIGGNVIACADQACATSQPLAGATVTLIGGSATVATTTTDSSGNYTFSNIPLGAYTINVAGYDASN